jgi:type IV pilus assembly protein PilO
MTNFQAQSSNRFGVTPERLMVALPVLGGGLLAGLLALAWLLPTWQRSDSLVQQRQLLQSQAEALAANRARLGRTREGLQQAEADQRKLLQIVAGTDQLDTLLAQLAVEAVAADVTLESYEPQDVAPSPPKRSNANANEAPPIDPLLVWCSGQTRAAGYGFRFISPASGVFTPDRESFALGRAEGSQPLSPSPIRR